jgi:hypothetical protein
MLMEGVSFYVWKKLACEFHLVVNTADYTSSVSQLQEYVLTEA